MEKLKNKNKELRKMEKIRNIKKHNLKATEQ